MTSKVPVREICRAISKYAFVTSPYPVIISAEVHCSIAQQEAMYNIMVETFGDALIRAPDLPVKIEQLPSPEMLRGKFLLKVNFYLYLDG